MKRTTIFKQLITNIITPVLLSFLVLTAINFHQTRQNLKDYSEEKNEIITSEIKHILELQEFSLGILDKSLAGRMEMLSNKIVNEYLKDINDIDEINLFQIAQDLGMDNEKEHIYLIDRQGIVRKSTFLQDINLNMYDFGEDHRKYLESIFSGDAFVDESISIEDRTKRPKKYSYQPTLDKQYIMELGSYSEEADEIIKNIKGVFTSLMDADKGILKVDIFINRDNPFAFNRIGELPEGHKTVLEEVFDSKGKEEVIQKKDKEDIKYEYIYMYRRNTSLYKDAVIQIVSTNSYQIKQLKRELFKSLLIFVITICLVILLIYKRAKVITEPIKKLAQHAISISTGDFKERVEIKGNNEMSQLSEQFNRMITTIEDSYKMLENKVDQRTEEISMKNEQLAQKNKLLSEINQNQKVINQKLKESEANLREVISTKDKFFSIISHDLKNPLNSLISLTELLNNGIKEDIDANEILELSSYIHQSSKHLFNLLENLLQWASSHTGKLKFMPENFDLKEVVEETIILLRLNAEAKNIKLVSQVKVNTLVYADKDMITTVIRNILSNAIKFSHESSEVVIDSGLNKNFVETYVQDFGIGISEDNLKKLFQKDELFSTTGTGEEKGTGLGLILTKEFIEKNGGSIWVNSQEGKGTKFTFQIPRERSVSSLLTSQFTENPM